MKQVLVTLTAIIGLGLASATASAQYQNDSQSDPGAAPQSQRSTQNRSEADQKIHEKGREAKDKLRNEVRGGNNEGDAGPSSAPEPPQESLPDNQDDDTSQRETR